MSLPMTWIDRIFQKLDGFYGQQFRGKFSRIVEGVDIGVNGAKESWADELAGFEKTPESIGYALQNLPSDHCPNAGEFRDLCRRAPKKEVPALTYAFDQDKSRKFAAELAEVVGSANRGSDPRFWAAHPRSRLAFDFIKGAASNNPTVFQPCINHLIAKGRVSEDGKHLLQKYAGNGQWVKA